MTTHYTLFILIINIATTVLIAGHSGALLVRVFLKTETSPLRIVPFHGHMKPAEFIMSLGMFYTFLTTRPFVEGTDNAELFMGLFADLEAFPP